MKRKALYLDDSEKELDALLENEDFWEFEALQIFINDNPFDQAYKGTGRIVICKIEE